MLSSQRLHSYFLGHNLNQRNKNSNRINEGAKCGHSGPSIHAGPKAFAEMTGLGPGGKPQPHSDVPVCKYEVAESSSFSPPFFWHTLLHAV